LLNFNRSVLVHMNAPCRKSDSLDQSYTLQGMTFSSLYKKTARTGRENILGKPRG